MKVVLFGSNGRVGSCLGTVLGPTCDLHTFSRAAIDLETDPSQIVRTIKEIRPSVVINATACNGPEKCADAPSVAYAVNVNAVAAMAAACRDIGAFLVHYSTDYVFGDSLVPLDEQSETGPVNLYGLSKLAGEKAVQIINPYHAIFRLSSVYGADHAGPLDILKQVAAGKGTPENPAKVLRQLCCPISAQRVAELTYHALQMIFKRHTLRLMSGVYHMAPAGAVWKSDFARGVLDLSGYRGPVSIVEGTLAQPRPTTLLMDGTKFSQTFGVKPWNPYEDLGTMFKSKGLDLDNMMLQPSMSSMQ